MRLVPQLSAKSEAALPPIPDDGPPPSSIDKAFRLLNVFTQTEPCLSLSDLQRLSGLAMTTTHRTANQLVEIGALEQQSDGRYRVGMRLWRLGCLAPTVDLERAAHPYMQSLYDRFRMPVQLSVRDGAQLAFVARCAATPFTHNPRVGDGYTMHAAAAGQLLLAFAPDDVRESVLARPLQRYTDATLTTPQQLRQRFAQIRTSDAASSPRELRDDLLTVASPIRDGDGDVIAALSFVIAIAHADAHPWITIAKAATTRISQLLARSEGRLPHIA